MKPGKVALYPAASALPTRASAAEVQLDDEAPTSLDPPTFAASRPPEWLGAPPVPAPVPPRAAAPPPAVHPSEVAGLGPLARSVSGAPAVVAWVAIAGLGVLSGIAGALLGIWLALGGG